MRPVRIEMTQAAKGRLNLLQDLDALPLPLDVETLRPFGFRFHQSVMIVTYENRDVAYVPAEMNRDKKSFNLLTPMTPNDTADAALRRVMSTLTAHLDRVGAIINAQKREITAEHARQQKERDQDYALRTARSIEILSDLWVADERVWTAMIDEKDLINAARSQVNQDTMLVSRIHNHFTVIIGVLPRLTINLLPTGVRGEGTHMEFRTTRDPFHHSPQELKDAVTAFEQQGRKPDMNRIRDEILRLSARTTRVNDMPLLVETIAALPARDYSVEAYLLNPPTELNPAEIMLDNDIHLSISRERIKISREDVHLRTLQMPVNTLVTNGAAGFLDARSRQCLMMDDAQRRTLVTFAIGALADANPDVDFDVFRSMDPTALAEAELNTNAGYTF